MKIIAGSRWKSAVCATEVVVVKVPKTPGELQCGGSAMLPMNADKPAGAAPAAGQGGGTLLGKHYVDEQQGLEVLCTKAGQGSIAFDGRPLAIRAAKLLPSSD
ncbi:MAG: hypothetical protein U1F11_10120 [Steroidobacteraceae bacterium]